MNLIDLHCDTLSRLYSEGGNLTQNKYHIDLEKLKKANSIAQFFAVFVNKQKITAPFDFSKKMINLFYSELNKNKDTIAFASNYSELELNIRNNTTSAFLTIEGGEALEGSMKNFYTLKELGVSLITLTWNYPNEIGYPNYGLIYRDRGLTAFGRDLIEEMNTQKVIIDVSHLSDAGFYDVAKISNEPFIASHSNARFIENNERNLKDDMIKIIANKGGLIGINFYSHFLNGTNYSNVHDIVKHISYIKKIGGIDVLSLGSDFDGINCNLELQDISYIDKLEHGLKKANFTDDEIEKIFYKNTLKFLKNF